MRKPKSVDIIAAVYPDEEKAEIILNMLKNMHSAATITMVDAAMVTKSEDGKVHIHETHEVTTRKGARRGALVTGIFGLIYPPSLIGSLAVGGALGGLMGRLRDTGIKLPQIEAVGADLTPGKVAIVAMVDSKSTTKTRGAMDSFGGSPVVQQLHPDATSQILGDEMVLEQAGDEE